MDDNLQTRSAEMRETPSPLPSPLPSPSPSPLDSAIPSPNPDQKPATSTPSITSTTTPPPPSTTTTTSNSKRPRESSTRPSIRRIQTNRISSASNSPAASRESSPVRPLLRTTSAARAGTPSRSRKNSQDISPSRSASAHNPPSAAAIQRLLSGQTIPPLNHVASDPSIKAPIPQKPLVTSEVRDGPRWPVSPRLRSPPPPRQNSILSPRRAEQDPLAINVQRTSPSADQQTELRPIGDSEAEENLLAPGMRTPARGASGGSSTLETVQEISQPNTPGLGLDGATDTSPNGVPGLATDNYSVEGSSHATIKARPSIVTNESGSDSGGKGEIRMKNTTPTTSRAMGPPKSFAPSAIVGRGKPSGEGLARNMTVETETVSSIPQVAVGTGVGGLGNSGSLRAKQSTETIRPRKEKKKARKAPSVTSGTGEQLILRPRLHHHDSIRSISDAYSAWAPDKAHGQGLSPPRRSSDSASPERPVPQLSPRRPSLNLYSADIFEAKVASAVDEANSSDSEETFVYESNPPEAERPRRFHHSRTPSATSMASQIDARNGVRSMMDASHSVAMKKSMKFVNSYNSAGPEMSTEDDGKGTARSNAGMGRGTAHHHHFSRWGRNGGNGHPSLFDNESPFPNAAKSKFSNTSRQGSRPTSPRVLNSRVAGVGNGKKTSPIAASYDLDDAADDERTPLIPVSVRSARSSRLRRTGAVSLRQMEHQRQERSVLGRFAGCLVLSVMVLLVISGAIGFMFATTQPLSNVKVLALKNILASEQDVILDMQVIAQNPNLVAVTVESMDMVIFAKSKYAGTDSEWWAHPPRTIGRRSAKVRRDDPINDPPIDHDPNTNPNLEIGHVYEFESPLIFEGSPFQHASSISLGEIRILKPGNQTEPRGSERWGRVLQHEFELIVRGTLRYTLPLSSKARSVGIEGRATVKPNAADQDPDNVHIIGGFDRV
ncbi:phospholipid metabolism enzyme regulator protein [Rutstroemia sp. NJR-2017a WRK4]|nr:phospholipid metabolism enzyme regulator protein [Rutstroemia sp. NJR-2017a WRK4]